MNELVSKQRTFFNTGVTHDLAFRKNMLRRLKRCLQDNEQALYEAIFTDFSKSEFDTYLTELALIYHEIDLSLKYLRNWSSPKRVATNLLNFPGKSYIMREPLGVSLIIGAWNYPYQLSLGPAVAAIAAGCTVIMKPSELPAKTSNLMAQIVSDWFDPEYFTVVEGGAEETSALLNQKFDKIFFTGSTRVGKIVYKAAAENLTPVTLELGGKSPAILCRDASLKVSIKRLVWAKFLNAGQTCIAPDYLLVPKEQEDQILQLLKDEIEAAHYKVENGNYVQIINQDYLRHLSSMIDPQKIYMGGRADEQMRTIEPTVLRGVEFSDPVMQEEIFGPILPVLTFDSLQEAINMVKARPRPLACYVFTSNRSKRKKVLEELSFGGGAVNDAVVHIANPNLPFGGVGPSGTGSYHGEAGFLAFSHQKSILQRPALFEPNLKYYPQTKSKLNIMKQLFRF